MITEITLKLKSKEIKLTLDEVKELSDELNSLLNRPSVSFVPVPQPYPVYQQRPIWFGPHYLGDLTCGPLGASSFSRSAQCV